MGFKVLINGQAAAEESAQVLEVAIQTSQGEKFRFGVGELGAIDIVLKTVQAGDPIRLDQLEAAQAQARRQLVEGQVTGQGQPDFVKDLLTKQGVSNSTLVPGEGHPVPTSISVPPVVDLSQGLALDDVETRTARINAFNQTGDAKKAVEDYPPGSGHIHSPTPSSPPVSETNQAPAPPPLQSGPAGKVSNPFASIEDEASTDDVQPDEVQPDELTWEPDPSNPSDVQDTVEPESAAADETTTPDSVPSPES